MRSTTDFAIPTGPACFDGLPMTARLLTAALATALPADQIRNAPDDECRDKVAAVIREHTRAQINDCDGLIRADELQARWSAARDRAERLYPHHRDWETVPLVFSRRIAVHALSGR